MIVPIIIILIIAYFLFLIITIKAINFWVEEIFKEKLNVTTQLRKINFQLYVDSLYQRVKDGQITIEEMEQKIKDFEI